MSNLLDFQHNLLGENSTTVIYSIATAEINPKDLEVSAVENTSETFNLKDYNQKSLRDYIQKHSQTLTDYGDVIRGERKNSKVTLTVLKAK